MTVAELIEELKKFPPDRMVLVDGYEDGYDHPAQLKSEKVVSRGHRGYNGEFDDYRRTDDIDRGQFWAVIIPR
jgi:hypothetical protein